MPIDIYTLKKIPYKLEDMLLIVIYKESQKEMIELGLLNIKKQGS